MASCSKPGPTPGPPNSRVRPTCCGPYPTRPCREAPTRGNAAGRGQEQEASPVATGQPGSAGWGPQGEHRDPRLCQSPAPLCWAPTCWVGLSRGQAPARDIRAHSEGCCWSRAYPKKLGEGAGSTQPPEGSREACSREGCAPHARPTGTPAHGDLPALGVAAWGQPRPSGVSVAHGVVPVSTSSHTSTSRRRHPGCWGWRGDMPCKAQAGPTRGSRGCTKTPPRVQVTCWEMKRYRIV